MDSRTKGRRDRDERRDSIRRMKNVCDKMDDGVRGGGANGKMVEKEISKNIFPICRNNLEHYMLLIFAYDVDLRWIKKYLIFLLLSYEIALLFEYYNTNCRRRPKR